MVFRPLSGVHICYKELLILKLRSVHIYYKCVKKSGDFCRGHLAPPIKCCFFLKKEKKRKKIVKKKQADKRQRLANIEKNVN
jgi:hypothetical protein